MSKRMGSMVVVYGLVVALLAFSLQRIAPALGKIGFIAGMVAGGVSVLWGVAGLAGYKRRTGSVVTIVVLTYVLLNETARAWSAPANETPGKLAGALVLSILLLSSVGMLLYILPAKCPPDFYNTGTIPRNNPGTGEEIKPIGGGRDH